MSVFKKAVLIVAAIVVLILGVWFAIIWHRVVHAPLQTEKQTLTVKVPAGTGIHYLATQLHEQGLLPYPRLFIFLARVRGEAQLLKAGEYQITPGMTAPDLLANIAAGKVFQRTITFVEGWAFRQMMQVLNDNSHIKHTLEGLNDHEIMEKLGQPNQYPEGLFFPDTYSFTWGNTDVSLLEHAYKRMEDILNKEWDQRASGLPYENAYQALIVASLIEKETALPQERAKISGVILQRLKKRMPLQVDPTVLYGLGKPYGSEITKEDLASKNPYNTYQRYGLPPTPIDMPSRASIEAALHPDESDALYYVATGDGGHVFSATYEEHLKAVEKYQRRVSTLTKENNAE